MAFLVKPIKTEKRTADPIKAATGQAAAQVPQQASQPDSGYTDNPARQQERQRNLEQQRREPTAVAIPTEWKRDAAQRMYDAYIQSDEYRQNLAANMKAQTDEWMQASLAGSEGYTPTPRKDQKEQQLKALVDHYTAQMEQEANQATLEQAMGELEMWSPEERKMLEMYGVQRDQEILNPIMNPITGGSYQIAGKVAADLIAKYGEAKVNRMAEALEWKQSAEATEAAGGHGQEMAGGTFFDNVGADLLSIGEKGVGNLTGLMGYITELGRRTGQFSTLNPNNIGQLPNVHGDAIQEQKAQNLAADGGKWDAYVYKGATSAADSALRMAMGGGAVGGAVLSATGSFARSVSEASARGASPAEAAAYGTATAGIEYLTEKLPLDKLMAAAKTGGHTWKEIAKSALIQGGIEATEEELSLIGTTLAEAGILKEKAGYQQRINELVAGGMPLAEAQNAAFSELLEEAKDTAITSFLSGGMSEVGASIAGNLTHREDLPAANTQQNAESAANTAATEQMNADAYNQEASEGPAQTEQERTDQAYEMTAGVEQKPAEQLTPQEKGARYRASKVNAAVLDLVDRVRKGQTKGSEKVQLSNVSDTVAAQIQRETGIDTRGYSVAIEARQVEHILNRHGENGKANGSMANPEDLGRVEYVLNNPDRVSKSDPTKAYVTNRDGKMKPADTVLYEAQLEDGSYYVVQAVPETKKRTLYIVSAFIGKSDYKNEALQSANAADPGATPGAESTVTPRGATQSTDTSSPGATSETAAAGTSKNSVPQTGPEVNGNVDESGTQREDSPGVYSEEKQPEQGNKKSSPTYEELVRKSDIPVVRVGKNKKGKTYADLKNDVLQMAEFGNWYNAPYTNKDTNMPVFITRKSFTHSFSRLAADFGEDTLLALQEMPKLIREAVLVDVAAPKNPNKPEQRVMTFLAAIDSGKGVEPVKITVKEYDSNDGNPMPKNILDYFTKAKESGKYRSLYDLKALEVVGIEGAKKELGASAIVADGRSGPEANSTPNSSIRVADLLGLVKGDAEKYIPKPNTKRTVAAEANFSGKAAYQDLLTDDNTQPDRRDDVRPMELPKRDINGNNVSAVTGNVYGSKITPDEFASLMEEPTARGDFSYVKITNEQAVERAKETIAGAETWENAYKEWSNEVALGTAGPEMSARGALLLNHAAKQGNKGEWLSILSDLQKLGTNTAQGLQAMRIIRSLNPADRTTIIKNQIRSMVRDMKLDGDIRPDEGLLNKYVQAKTEKERDAILEEIQQNVADQIPSTFLDKFTALRYMNMLGNIKTNVRNIAGNAVMKGAYKVKDTMAAGVEEVLHRASGGKFEKTQSLTVSRKLRKACKADFAQYAGIVSDGGKFGDRQSGSNDFAQGVMDKRRIFKGDVNTKSEKFNAAANKVIDTALTPMEWYRKGTNWAMNNKYLGDEAFGRGAYSRAMAGYLKAHGVKGGDLSKVDEALLDKARAYAIQEAQEATFHDNTALARIVQRGQKNFGIVGEGIMPFTKTPANILVRAEEFSPLGLINSTVKTVQATKKDSQITGADIVNSWAKTLTGTAIFAIGALLKDQGWLTASGDDDEEKAAFDKLNGEQEYALMLPNGVNYTIDFLGPAVMPLFMGAELSKAIEEAGGFDELTWADWENILTSVSDPMLQMSMLSGINDSLSNIKYADNSLLQFCINAAVSYLTQGLGNTLMGQIEKSTEEVRTQTHIDKDGQMPQWMQRQLGSLSQKVPGWDFQQTPYIDVKGQEQAQRTDLGGWLYNLVSPGYLDKKEVDAVSEELYRLHETGEAEENIFPETPATTFSYTDKDGVKHEDYNLTAKEAETLKRQVGEIYMGTLKDLLASDTYAAMTEKQKVDAALYAEDYAREKGRTEAVQGYEGMSDWMKAIDGDAAKAILDKTVESAFTDAFSLLDKDPAAAATALDQAYSLVDRHGITEWAQEAGGKTEYFINAKRREVSAEAFCGLYQQFREIDKDESLDVGQKAQEWADYLQKAQEAGTITKAQKEAIRKDMLFRYSMPAGTEKYDTMVELGVNSDNADMIAHLLDGITGTGKGGAVTDADKWGAIATAKLPDKERDAVMKAYMPDYDPKATKPDYTELKYDYIRQKLGLSAEEYVETYQAVQKGKNKSEDIANIKALGYDQQTAAALYDVYNSTKKGKKAYMDLYEELYG